MNYQHVANTMHDERLKCPKYSSKYCAKWKVNMLKCRNFHAKWQVPVPNCCKYKASSTRKEIPQKTQTLSKKNSKNYSSPLGKHTAAFFQQPFFMLFHGFFHSFSLFFMVLFHLFFMVCHLLSMFFFSHFSIFFLVGGVSVLRTTP